MRTLSTIARLAILCITALPLVPPLAYATEGDAVQKKEYDWIEGTSQTVPVGEIAELKLDPEMVFLNKENTRRFLTENGNIFEDSDIASVFPINAEWSVYFQYTEEGHVQDDEKSSIDAGALLESYKKGTEERNKQRCGCMTGTANLSLI